MSFETAEDRKQSYFKDYSIFPKESNLHYRYESAEELLNNLDILAEMIEDHYHNQVPRLSVLDDYYKANNPTIKQNKRRVDDEKIDYNPAHNFAKVGAQFDVGYNTGIPIKTVLDDKSDMVDDFNKFNDIDTLNSELWLDMDKYGRAYELHHRDENYDDYVFISNVFITFVVYDTSPMRNPILAVRYPKVHFGEHDDEILITVYTQDEIIQYETTELSNIQFNEKKREDHDYQHIPILEIQPNRYRQGLYEDVLSLIDLYDAAQADTANYMSDLANATLVISGNIDSAGMTTEDLIKQKRANLLLLESGIDAQGKETSLGAGYIYKQYDVNGTEAYKKRLVQDIHKFMNVPDLTDEQFAGVQSGEAMKYKLSGYSQQAMAKQRIFSDHLDKRYELLYNIQKEASEVTEIDIHALEVIFTPNIPQSMHEELDVLVNAGAQFSQKTLLDLASFITNADEELEKIEEENKIGRGYDFEMPQELEEDPIEDGE